MRWVRGGSGGRTYFDEARWDERFGTLRSEGRFRLGRAELLAQKHADKKSEEHAEALEEETLGTRCHKGGLGVLAEHGGDAAGGGGGGAVLTPGKGGAEVDEFGGASPASDLLDQEAEVGVF